MPAPCCRDACAMLRPSCPLFGAGAVPSRRAQPRPATVQHINISCRCVPLPTPGKPGSITVRLWSSWGAGLQCFVLFYNASISHPDAADLTYCISLFLIRFCSLFPSTSESRSVAALSAHNQRSNAGGGEKPPPDASLSCGCWHGCSLCPSGPRGWDGGLHPHKLKGGSVCFIPRKEMCSSAKALGHGRRREASARVALGPVSPAGLHPHPPRRLRSQHTSSCLLFPLPALRAKYQGVFFRGVNYLIPISDSEACRCNIQLLKPLDL